MFPAICRNIPTGNSASSILFPNPTNSSVSIQFSNLKHLGGSYYLYDGTGRVVLNGELGGYKTTISGLDILSLGIYVMEIVNVDGTKKREKLIIAD